MRAAYFRGDRVVEHTEVSTPEPGEGQVLIRVAANAVCGMEFFVTSVVCKRFDLWYNRPSAVKYVQE